MPRIKSTHNNLDSVRFNVGPTSKSDIETRSGRESIGCSEMSDFGLTPRTGAVVPVFLLCLLLALPSCAREAESSTKPAAEAPVFLSVKAVKIEPAKLLHKVEITGTLVSSDAVDLKTEFPGKLVAITKEEGDYIRQGEVVAQLDPANPKLAVDQAEANLQTAVAALERGKVMEEHARIEDERARNLLQSGGITDRDLQAAQTALKDARAQVRLAEAQIEQARQMLAQAKKRLEDCSIVAPISGEVERKFLNRGSYLDGGAILYRIVDNSRLELETNVPAAELSRLKRGQQVLFSVSSYPAEQFEGRVQSINPAVVSQNRALLLQVTVPNPGGKLKAGMFARGAIVTGSSAEALMVPANAVWRRPNQAPFVYVVEQNQARKREVGIGIEQPEGIEISKGLNPGDIVVSEQYLELADGSKVSPLL